jgi:hypothetical protein
MYNSRIFKLNKMKNEYYIVKSSGGSNLPYTSINVLEYTANTTYSPSSNLLYARVVCVGGGGGGGAGRVSSGTTIATGGQSGQGGLIASNILYSTQLTAATYNVVIGNGGTGGAGVSALVDTNGNDGTNGGNTSFGTVSTPTYVLALGGVRGISGRAAGNSGYVNLHITGCRPNSIDLCIQSQYNANTGAAAGSNGTIGFGDLGGTGKAGNGGGKTTAAFAGGNGGRGYDKDGNVSAVVSGGAIGGNGSNGLDNVSLQIIEQYPISGVTAWNTLGIGTGGSGGGSSITNNISGGNGGHGGLYGTGGGGGGAGLTGAAPNGSGAGGDGSQGLCIIIEYLS